MLCRWILAALLSAGLLSACGSSGVPVIADLGRGEIAETLEDILTPESFAELGAEESIELPEVHWGKDAGDVEDLVPDVVPGGFGWPCATGADCFSGFCIQTTDGKLCTQACVEECPDQWLCVPAGSGPDVVSVCAPLFSSLCRPCRVNADCTSGADELDTGARCIDYGPGGSFCGAACDPEAELGAAGTCPEGYQCMDAEETSGATATQCVVTEGECACSQWFIDQGADTDCTNDNEFGTCNGTRACSADGLSACNAKVPEAESCNAADDDCDTTVDEETGGGECFVQNPFGMCPGTEICQGGIMSCEGAAPAPETCDGLDNDCDGEIDQGFEDTDKDGIADCLESDKDGDGVLDGQDNCPALFNPGQDDVDLDTVGDLCDPDDDNDLTADADDCAPKDPDAFPGNTEICDGKDNDCDLVADEGFPDSDGDGLKDCLDDDDDNDLSPDDVDCAPLDSTISPTALEMCDGEDNDCDGSTDEDYPDADGDGTADCVDDDADGDGIPNGPDNCPLVPNPEQLDLDGDGIGDSCDPDQDGDAIPDAVDNCPDLKNTLQGDIDKDGLGDACDSDDDADGVADPDDNCPVVANPDQLDMDGDSIGDACEADTDGDGTENGLDCAPLDPAVHPGAQELCDGADNDCSGDIDEGFVDSDFDGLKDCVDLDDDNDLTGDDGDCAPLDPQVHPDATEICNGIDDDCDALVDEEIGILACGKGLCFHTTPACKDGAAQLCDPMAGAAIESCDGLDNDCDGLVDEDLGWKLCGLGPCQHLLYSCSEGQEADCDPFEGAEPESCDGQDNDCDGLVDEGLGSTTCGLGACVHTVANCSAGQPQACDPMAGAWPESCDGLDNDCDGHTDEDLGSTTCGLGPCEHTAANCADGAPQVCDPLEGAEPESCDGLDNDCDGKVDNGCPGEDCQELLAGDPTLASGTYAIDPDGPGGAEPFDVFCDMSTDGGGWTTAFDDTDGGQVFQAIPDGVLSLTASELLLYSANGGPVQQSFAAGLTSLADAFAQDWIPCSFEDDHYKPLGTFAGTKKGTAYIFDDHDVTGGPTVSCSGHQVLYEKTPDGLISFGYAEGNNFGDGGTCDYALYTGAPIQRVLVR